MKSFNKNLFLKVLCAVLVVGVIVAAVTIVIIDSFRKEPPEQPIIPEYVTVMYTYNKGYCDFIGESCQTIIKGEDSTPITIVPKLGYYFCGWADASSPYEYFDDDKFTRQENNVQEDIWLIARFTGPVNSHAIFGAEKGGRVEGKLEQTVIYGGKGERVTAIPDKGYRFVKWSDGETEAVRENQSLRKYGDSSPYIYAEFERYSRTFEYAYNGGTSENEETEIEINLDNINEISLPVPTRENCVFGGWYSDWHQELQVADENGQLMVGTEWLNNDDLWYYTTNPEGHLYAKWTTAEELPTYKILMIYITEVHGDFKYWNTSQDYEIVRVDYVMPDIHRRICRQITEFMSKYLNAVFNETVRFEVDEYFTTEAIDENQFVGDGKIFLPKVDATNGIQELQEIRKNYDSVLTTYSLCGYENDSKLTGPLAGSSRAKYGSVVLDTFLSTFNHIGSGYYGDDLENIFDYYYHGSFHHWESFMEMYIHEFIHTVEMQVAGIMDNIGLHAALKHYSDKYGAIKADPYDVVIPFLLNEYEADDEYWGIPYEFWVNNDKNRN